MLPGKILCLSRICQDVVEFFDSRFFPLDDVQIVLPASVPNSGAFDTFPEKWCPAFACGAEPDVGNIFAIQIVRHSSDTGQSANAWQPINPRDDIFAVNNTGLNATWPADDERNSQSAFTNRSFVASKLAGIP